MTKDKALKLALEWFESVDEDPAYGVQGHQVIAAIKEALMSGTDGAQPEQEPVATDWERIARVQDAKLRAMCNEAGGFEKLCEVMDKYERTTPPQRPSRSDIKPLTDEEIETLWPLRPTDEIVAFARAIEAVHGIIAPTELKEEV